MALTQVIGIASRQPGLLLQGLLLPLGALTLLVLTACGSASSDVVQSTERQSAEDDTSSHVVQSAEGQPAEDHTPSVVVQSSEEALAQDLALVAEAKGWTIEEAAADHRASDIVGGIAGQVAAERPGVFVGSVLSPEPGGVPALYIKGPADQFVLSLVANAEIDIEIVDNQPFSFDELQQRKLQVHRALEAQGFQYISTGFSITDGGQIISRVTRQTGLPDDPDEILSSLPAELRSSVTLTVSDAPVVVDENAFGGIQMRDDGFDGVH